MDQAERDAREMVEKWVLDESRQTVPSLDDMGAIGDAIAAALRQRDEALAEAARTKEQDNARWSQAMGERDQARAERDAAVAQQAADLRSYQGIAQALRDTMKEIGAQRDAAVEALADYAKHAADSGWYNLAEEIRARIARLPHAAERARLDNAERDHARAERDAAVECLRWYADFDCEGTAGDEACNLGKRARACLASLPHAAERAQAQRDVVAAARDVPRERGSHLWKALARLDALESGGG